MGLFETTKKHARTFWENNRFGRTEFPDVIPDAAREYVSTYLEIARESVPDFSEINNFFTIGVAPLDIVDTLSGSLRRERVEVVAAIRGAAIEARTAKTIPERVPGTGPVISGADAARFWRALERADRALLEWAGSEPSTADALRATFDATGEGLLAGIEGLGRGVGAGVGAVGTGVGKGLGAALQGLLSGLGPLGALAIVGGAVYLAQSGRIKV